VTGSSDFLQKTYKENMQYIAHTSMMLYEKAGICAN
jgi:hypothetical protein